MFKLIAVFFLTFCFSTFATAQMQQAQISVKKKAKSKAAVQENTNKKIEDALEGTVTLKVMFLASGEIGEIEFISAKTKDGKDFDYGLISQAIEAAKKIKFDPPKRNGQPYSVKKTVTYTFTIY